MTPTTTLDDLPHGFRVADLSKALRIPRATLYRWIRTGQLPAVAVGKVLVVLQKDLSRFLEDARTAGASSEVGGLGKHHVRR